MKILLVEDEPFMQAAMSHIIETSGFEVIKTDNLNDAIQHLATETISLLMTDLYLPQPDGFALVNHVKNHQLTKHIPVIVVTGIDHHERLVSTVPADVWLIKPFTLDEMRSALRKCTSIEA